MQESPQLENGYLKIANELWDALIKYRLPGEQEQCLKVILRQTYGWNKKTNSIKLSDFVEATGINKQNVSRALKSLKNKNVIIIIKEDNKTDSTYGINKRFKTWEPLSKKITLSKKIKVVIKKDNEPLSKKIIPPIYKNKKDIIKDKDQKNNFPEWLDRDLWSEYKKMRIRIRKPMTPYAEKLAFTSLKKLIDSGQNQIEVLNQSIQNSWQGLFPVKKNGMNQKAPNRVTTDTSKYGED